MSAACRGVMVSAAGITCAAETIARSASPPQALLSPVQAIVRHRWPSPRTHSWQWPQEMSGITVHRSPSPTWLTPGPVAATTAENSCPRICGSSAPVSGCGRAGVTIGPSVYSCRSVPQIPHITGRRSTSPGPGGPGSDTFSTPSSRALMEAQRAHGSPRQLVAAAGRVSR